VKEQGVLPMTQQDRDRLVVLRKAEKRLIGQGQAARELGITGRQVRRLLLRLKREGDRAVIHKLRGRPSNRKTDGKTRERIVLILSEEVYRDFGPTLGSEYLADKHDIRIGREALRQVMISAGLWRARGQKVDAVHQWRERRSCRGDLIQWDTSTHDWLEGRGETIYLIHMIDDATSELTARFVRHARPSSPLHAQSLRSGVPPVAVCIHNRKALRTQQAGKPGCHRALGGLVPTASGANSVASALGFRSGATPFGHDHTNTTFRQPSSKPDISIWQTRGHFYLALTSVGVSEAQMINPRRRQRPSAPAIIPENPCYI
jgi:hypothetical protein